MSFFLANTSFVFIVEVSDPSRFSAIALAKAKVIADEPQMGMNLTLPFLSQINFHNGFSFEAREERVMLAQEANLPSDAASAESEVRNLEIPKVLADAAINLIPMLTPLRLQSVGINFRVFAVDASLDNFTNGLPGSSKPVSLQFYATHEGVQTNYTLTASIATQNVTLQGVLIDVNFNGQLVEMSEDSNEARAEQMLSLVERQQEFFESMKGILDVLDFQ